jgi:tetratricopeptide (TPR) repeat protein
VKPPALALLALAAAACAPTAPCEATARAIGGTLWDGARRAAVAEALESAPAGIAARAAELLAAIDRRVDAHAGARVAACRAGAPPACLDGLDAGLAATLGGWIARRGIGGAPARLEALPGPPACTARADGAPAVAAARALAAAELARIDADLDAAARLLGPARGGPEPYATAAAILDAELARDRAGGPPPPATTTADAVRLREIELGPSDHRVAIARAELGRAALAAGRLAEAGAALAAARRGLERAVEPTRRELLETYEALGALARARGEPGDAVSHLEEAMNRRARVTGRGSYGPTRVQLEVARALVAAGRPAEAAGAYRAAIEASAGRPALAAVAAAAAAEVAALGGIE